MSDNTEKVITDLILKLEQFRWQHLNEPSYEADVIIGTTKELRKLKEENDKIKDWIRKLFLSKYTSEFALEGFEEEGLITIAQDTGEITYNYNT